MSNPIKKPRTSRQIAESPGRTLALWLRTEYEKLGLTRGAWCRQAQIPDSTVLRWEQDGAEPDLRNLRLAADALPGRSLLDLFIVMGVFSRNELLKLGRDNVPPRPPATFELALAQDPGLSAEERLFLSAALNAYRTSKPIARGRRSVKSAG